MVLPSSEAQVSLLGFHGCPESLQHANMLTCFPASLRLFLVVNSETDLNSNAAQRKTPKSKTFGEPL